MANAGVTDWSFAENQVIVAKYFDMLERELLGEPMNKAEENRFLQKELPGRSRGSIEFKHCNISAVLAQEGSPYIWGYKPRANTQDLLRTVVLRHLFGRPNVVVRGVGLRRPAAGGRR